MKFIIVGHVDHGKSTLIGRLLYDTGSLPSDRTEVSDFAHIPDCLEEERRQGLTVDVTHASFRTGKREYTIIDVPGHVEFVRNMITGATQADAAVLIVDAQRGVEEQTTRHAYILALLGIKQVIVVLNKMDLVAFDEGTADALEDKISAFLGSVKIAPLACIPICALSGENVARRSDKMGWYAGPALLEGLNQLKEPDGLESRPLILPVQDVYKAGDKRIAVGKIASGAIAKGQKITVLPARNIASIESIEKYPGESAKAYAGESIGVTFHDAIFIDRGNIICAPPGARLSAKPRVDAGALAGEPLLSDEFKANVFWIANQPLAKNERLTIRCATQETMCKIETIRKRINSSSFEIVPGDAQELRTLEVGEVIIKTKKPLAIAPFDETKELGRFVLEREKDVCAGGIVV